MTIDNVSARYALDEYYHEWMEKIPVLSFPDGWQVKITPPFGGALVRFRVIKGSAEVSVYLDGNGSLGWYGKDGIEPYWEIYPHDGDIFRCDMSATGKLMDAISESLKQQLEPAP